MTLKVQNTAVKATNGGGSGSTTGTTNAFGSNITAGNYVVVQWWGGSATKTMVSTDFTAADQNGNTYVPVASGFSTDSQGGYNGFFYFRYPTVPGSSPIITITAAHAVFWMIIASEWTGLAISSPVDGTPTNANGAASATTTNATPGSMAITAGSIVFGVVQFDVVGAAHGTIATPTGGFLQMNDALDDHSNDASNTNQYGQAIYYEGPASPSNPTWVISSSLSTDFFTCSQFAMKLAATFQPPQPVVLGTQAKARRARSFKPKISVNPFLLFSGITHVQTNGIDQTAPASNAQVTMGSNFAVNDLIIVGIVGTKLAGTPIFTVTDSLGNAYQSTGARYIQGTLAVEIFFCSPCKSGTTPTITVTPDTAATISFAVSEYKPAAGTYLLDDGINGTFGTLGTSFSSGGPSLSKTPELMYAVAGTLASAGIITGTGGAWNERFNSGNVAGANDIEVEDQLQATSTSSPSWTVGSAANYAAATASFRATPLVVPFLAARPYVLNQAIKASLF